MHITNQDGGDRVLAWRRELVDSATQMMVADEFYDDKPWVDLSEGELMQRLKTFADVDVQQTSDEEFCGQIFGVLKMDASLGRRTMFMKTRVLRKYLADSGLTDVVKPNGRQYTLKHGKVLVEAIAAGIEPLKFRRKVERKMRFDLLTYDSDELFSIIAKQQRDQAVIDANDAARRKRQSGMTPGQRLLRGPCRREVLLTSTIHASAKDAGVKVEQNHLGTPKTRVLYVASKVTSSEAASKANRVRKGKASMARAMARPPSSSSSNSLQAVPLSIPGERPPAWPLRLPPPELVRTRLPEKRWLRRPNLLRLKHLRRVTTTTCTFACRGRR